MRPLSWASIFSCSAGRHLSGCGAVPACFAGVNFRRRLCALLQTILQWQAAYHLSDVIVGMESTGHYWLNLARWLTDQDIAVVLVNPATTKRHKENRDNSPAKNDPKDAAVIADLVGAGTTSPTSGRLGP